MMFSDQTTVSGRSPSLTRRQVAILVACLSFATGLVGGLMMGAM